MIKKHAVESGSVKSEYSGGKGRSVMTWAAAAGVAGLLGLGALGCDTAARISFPKRSFQKIESSGFTATPGACMGVEDGDMKVRFVLLDNESSPIMLGSTINSPDGGSVGVELASDSVSLRNGALMEVTPKPCDDQSECSSEPFRFTCGEALPGSGVPNSCYIEEAGLTVASRADAVEFVADTQNDQVFGLLMEVTGGLNGWNLPGTEGAWDRNGNGQVGDPEDLGTDRVQYGKGIATDDANKRIQGLQSAFGSWIRAYTLARATERQTFFGLWGFNAETRLTSYIDKEGRRGTPWAKDSKPINDAINDFQLASPKRSRANVYEAIIDVVSNSYSTDAMGKLGVAKPDSVEKMLVIFVDGYDDLRTNDADIEDAITAAKANNVRVFLLHLDPELGEPGQLRENPRYWEHQSPCASDAECKNFEECRKPRGYAPDSQSAITPIEGADQTYCLPKRDEFGRVGPIDDYARLACETEGGYIYMPSADAIERNMAWTPFALDGLWEAAVNSSEMRRKGDLGGVPLKVQAEMRVTVAGQEHGYSFSQNGGGSSSSSDVDASALDSRSVIFTAE